MDAYFIFPFLMTRLVSVTKKKCDHKGKLWTSMVLPIAPVSWWKTLNFLSFSPSSFSLTLVSLVPTAVQSPKPQHNCVRHVEAVGLPIKLAKVHLLVIQRLLCHKRFSRYRKSLVAYSKSPKCLYSHLCKITYFHKVMAFFHPDIFFADSIFLRSHP